LQKNAMVGGAVTGALVSAANSDDRKHIVSNAITGAAIATAAHYLHMFDLSGSTVIFS
jgi:hypothetical protein